MKKFKYILMIIACFLACISGGKALNGCSSSDIEEFNKVGSTSNMTGTMICSYGEFSTDAGNYCHIEVRKDNSKDHINPHYYIYKVCTYRNSGKKTAKIMYCSHKYGENQYEVHTPQYYNDKLSTPESTEVGFWYFDNTKDGNPNYHYSDDGYDNPDMAIIAKYLTSGIDKSNINDTTKDITNECPLYMGVRYEEGTNWEALQVSTNKNFNGSTYEDVSGATLKIATGSCYDTGDKYACTGVDVVTGKKVLVPPTKTIAEDPDLPDIKVEKYESNLCKTDGVLKSLDALHTIIVIARIAVPLIIIILASIEFGKCAIDGSEDMLKKSTMKLVKKSIIGLLVFVIPLSIDLIVGIFSDKDTSKFQYCSVCFTGSKTPSGETCDDIITMYDNYYKSEKESKNTEKDVKQLKGCANSSNNGLNDYAISKCKASDGTIDDACYENIVNDTSLRNKYQAKCNCNEEAENYVKSSNVCNDKSANTNQCKLDTKEKTYKSCIANYCSNDSNNGSGEAARQVCGNDNSCYNYNVSNLHNEYYNMCITNLN